MFFKVIAMSASA